MVDLTLGGSCVHARGREGFKRNLEQPNPGSGESSSARNDSCGESSGDCAACVEIERSHASRCRWQRKHGNVAGGERRASWQRVKGGVVRWPDVEAHGLPGLAETAMLGWRRAGRPAPASLPILAIFFRESSSPRLLPALNASLGCSRMQLASRRGARKSYRTPGPFGYGSFATANFLSLDPRTATVDGVRRGGR